MHIIIESKRLWLKEITPEAVNLLLDLDSDPEVMRFLTAGRSSTAQEVAAAIERSMEIYRQHQRRFGLWPAFTKDNDGFIGWFHLRPAKDSPEDATKLELGYRLKRSHWGLGLATEVSRVLVDYAFSWPEVDLVFATAMQENTGSRMVMEKIGMKQTKTYQESAFPGSDKTAVRYEILRSTWERMS